MVARGAEEGGGEADQGDDRTRDRHHRQGKALADDETAEKGTAGIAEIESADVQGRGEVRRVLRLVHHARLQAGDETERSHLLALATPRRSPHGRRLIPEQRVRPGLLHTLNALTEVPALVIGRRCDVLATNALARALLTDFDALPRRERNLVRFLFLDDHAFECRRSL